MVIAAKKQLIENAWDLDVFKLAYAVSLSIHEISKSFPKEETFSLTSQIRRCSKSICANLAEGFAKQFISSAEFKRFLAISLGSSAEMQVWIRYCQDLNYISQQQAKKLQNDYSNISRMLGKMHTNATT